MASSPGVPPFSLTSPRFDQSTFYGRWKHFVSMVNPANMLITSSQVDDSMALLEAYRAGHVDSTKVSDAELWEARRIKEAVIHPDTGKPIPLPLRMAAFIPINIPLIVWMTWPGASAAMTVAGQIANQSLNVGVNYANRNASSEQSMTSIAAAYVGATSVALGVSLSGRSYMLKHGAKLPPVVGRLVPYAAVATAGAAGMVIMRFKELTDGVMLKDHTGTEHGLSRKAGIIGVAKTALSRAVFFPIFPMVLPPLIMDVIARNTSILKKFPKAALPLEVVTIATCMMTFLPMAIAMFPQDESVPASILEPEFQGKVDLTGKPIEYFTFNKGL
ncbi:sideroflexin [Thecamonas trahens ATCC 50062]|uniref:Sideroflexin n=1 Tax=Thecamonas trahens ATCC 50062 TaxID=461836 RepID=A0A0L0DEP5_THETB|nr:sideroflexin [Thecamonas trahens ATCC 50062]KNC50769.1 sideroflexin [Thecamonas trahens ATCC 50062]|eukprot:XP_013756731.1 sideroflexin [Thecamonas trahens ATCC 50062]